MTTTKFDRFQRGSGVYTCTSCGKQTRETGDGESYVNMCRACYDDAGWYNAHTDEHPHENWDECPYCVGRGLEQSDFPDINDFMVWLNTFINEKGIYRTESFEVMGDRGWNFMTVQTVIDHIKITSKEEQGKIKDMLVKLDFHNADIVDYFKHLAQAIAR